MVRSATYSVRHSSSIDPPSLVWRWWRLKAVARTCSRVGSGQEVAGKLPGDELVEGEVRVERLDHPVAPGPHGPVDVGLIAEGVGVPRHVEPVDGHPLAEPGRGQQPVDQPLVGVRSAVGQEGVDLGEGRRQTGEVERHPADQPLLARLGRGREPLGLEPGQDEPVDRIPGPAGVLDLRQRNHPRAE